MMRRILYISPGGIGNLVMAIPALRSVRAAYPQAQITLLTAEPGVNLILDNEGLIDGVVTVDRSAPAVKALVNTIRGQAFDCAMTAGTVNPLSAGALMWLSGIPLRAGENIGGRGFFYTRKVEYAPLCHERDGALNIVEALGIEPVSLFPDLRITGEEQNSAENFLNRHGWKPGQILAGIHPGSAFRAAKQKRWPAQNFIQVIKRLHQKQFKVLLAAGPAEQSLAKEIAQAAGGNVINTNAELSLRATAAAIQFCRGFISNDSGIAHIAAAVATPLVVLFGPTEPLRVAPKGKKVIVLQTPKAGPVSGIGVEEVTGAIEKICGQRE